MKLFTLFDDPDNTELVVTAIHDEAGYRHIREALSNQYNLSVNEPNIQVYNVDIRGNRALTLRHIEQNGKPLADTTDEVLKYLHTLWGFDIKLESVTANDKIVKTYYCPEKIEKSNT
jgi:spore cortex formation protein SpoVR/YcgB (stage V sporulation)